MPTSHKNIVASSILAFVVVLSGLCSTTQAKRRLSVSENMPEFSATGAAGRTFEYKRDSKKVLLVAFLSTKRERTARAAGDIETVLGDLGDEANDLDVVVVVGDANESYFKSRQDGPAKKFHIVLDKDFELWGKFGIIVAPTLILGGTNGKVFWVKAGHSHTFAPLLRAQLNEALGIAQEADPNNVGQVRVVMNSTVGARVKRHLQMAQILRRKGRIESAVVQLHKAGELDPNSIDVALALAGLHLKTGHGGKALKVIARLVAGKLSDKMKLLLTSAQAKRQAGELDAAEKLLLEATGLDPNSSKALFELGKVYQKKEQTDKAMTVYRRALSLVFGDERAPADSTTN